ncbi:hypothetical protein L9F63_004403 [Diploptera punctata]|uniref:Uncharacterized protein n=1 Tax=Diploptera punctata TaxID=6984 RepID=A0AAD7ZGJ2_DIPPU|nr:hypothetical protein L9F63_004403 [Diploptera punctata]
MISDKEFKDATFVPESDNEKTFDSEMMTDTLEAEISKLETTLNSIKDELPDISNCSYNLEEGEIIDSFIEKDLKGKEGKNELSDCIASTDGEIIDSDIEVLRKKDCDIEKTNVLHFGKSKDQAKIYSDFDSTDGERFDSDAEDKRKEEYKKKEKYALKCLKSNFEKRILPAHSDIDSTDSEVLDSDAEIQNILGNRKKNSNTDFYNATPKTKKRKKSNQFSPIISPALMVPSACISCKENFHVPAHKKKCKGICQGDHITPNKKNIDSKSLLNNISNNFDTPKSVIPNKVRSKRQSNNRSRENLVVTDIENRSNSILSEIKPLSDIDEHKKSSQNLTLKAELTEEGQESDESYLELEISKELEDSLLYPDIFEKESIIALNKTETDVSTSTPCRICNPESNKSSESSLKIHDDNSAKGMGIAVQKYDRELKENNFKSKVSDRNAIVTNIDRSEDTNVSRPKSTPPGLLLRSGRIIKRSRSISPNMLEVDDNINKENTSHDKDRRHVEHRKDGDLKIVVDMMPPEVIINENNDKIPVFESKNDVPKRFKIKDRHDIQSEKETSENFETESSKNLPKSDVAIEVVCIVSPEKKKEKVEPEIIVIDDNSNEDKVKLPEDSVPKSSSRRDENYISNNPQENEDNNNPEWELLRKLDTDEERYRAMRERWRNLVIPDPNENLTCLSWRLSHNSLSSVSINNCKISDSASTALTDPKVDKIDSASTSNQNRKRPLSVDSALIRNEGPVKKHARTQSCTTVYEVKLEQLRKNIELEQQRIDNEEHDLVHLTDVERIHQRFDQARRTVQDSSMNKVKILEKACEEVRAFHSFYSGLDPESHSGDTFYLTNTQLQELWETERLYDQYKKFYSV